MMQQKSIKNKLLTRYDLPNVDPQGNHQHLCVRFFATILSFSSIAVSSLFASFSQRISFVRLGQSLVFCALDAYKIEHVNYSAPNLKKASGTTLTFDDDRWRETLHDGEHHMPANHFHSHIHHQSVRSSATICLQ